MKVKYHKYGLVSLFVFLSLIVFGYITNDVVEQSGGVRWHINFGLNSQNYGSIISAVFAYLSTVLLIITLNNQHNSNKINAIETHFFEYIKYQRNNVTEMVYKPPKSKIQNVLAIEGNIVVRKIFEEIKNVFFILQSTWDYKKKNIEIGQLEKSDIPSLRDVINLAYLIVFFGFEVDGMEAIKKLDINKCYDFLKSTIESNLLLFKMTEYDNSIKYYGGHQRRLGHYFRHFYQSVNYIDKQNILSYKEKYDYIKMLRAQLSTYEQYIFFFNSISELGKVWEIDVSFKNRDQIINKQLITKYNLIKNISAEIKSMSLNLKEFYPLVVFEGEDKNTVSGFLIINGRTDDGCIYRKELEKKYS